MITVLTRDNEVLGFPDEMSVDDIQRAISDDKNGTITQPKRNLYNDVFAPALKNLKSIFEPNFFLAGRDNSVQRAFATNMANSGTFGAIRPSDMDELYAAHPVASVAGQFAGFAGPMKAIGVGLTALRFPALVRMAVNPIKAAATRYPQFAEVINGAGKAVAGGMQAGASMGIYSGTSEVVKEVETQDHIDLGNVGKAVLHDAMLWGAAGAVSGAITKPLAGLELGEKAAQVVKDMHVTAGTLYLAAKAGGADDKDALLQGGMGAIYHLVHVAGNSLEARKYAMDSTEKLVSDYVKAKNPMVHDFIAERGAQEHLMNEAENVANEGMYKSAEKMLEPSDSSSSNYTPEIIREFIDRKPVNANKSNYILAGEHEKETLVNHVQDFISKYGRFNESNPIVGKFGHQMFFAPDARATKRLSPEEAMVEYASHFITNDPTGNHVERVFDKSKAEAVRHLNELIFDADGYYPDKDGVFYYKQLKDESSKNAVLVMRLDPRGEVADIYRVTGFMPDKSAGFINRKEGKRTTAENSAPAVTSQDASAETTIPEIEKRISQQLNDVKLRNKQHNPVNIVANNHDLTKKLVERIIKQTSGENVSPDKELKDANQNQEGVEAGKNKAEVTPEEQALKKEPWQMTSDEWDRARENIKPETFGSATKYGGSQAVARIKEVERLTYGVNDELRVKLSQAEKGEIEMTPDEAHDILEKINQPIQHKDVVSKALSEGKPVPPEVLAEYPDLKLTSESGNLNINAIPGAERAAQIGKELATIFSPRSAAPKQAVDEIMRLKGERDKNAFIIDRQTMNIQKQFDKMSTQHNVEFIDKIKRGEEQATPELQAYANMMREVEDAKFQEIQEYKPTAAYKENHYRVLWKKIPGKVSDRGFEGLFRRPLQGTKGFLKKSSLVDMSEGLEKGGVPFSYNPMVMWKAHLMDMDRFITAQKMWKSLKKIGYVQFVKTGENRPSGFVRLNDSIANVYFPVDEGLIKAGEFFVEENTARVLNNFLSRDALRSSAIGQTLLNFKNVTTSMELSLSPFHAAYVSLAADSQKIGNAFLKIANLSRKNPMALLDGLKDLATFGTAPVDYTKAGTRAIKYMTQEDFINTPEGAEFTKQFPDAKNLIDDLFTGGGKLAIHEDYKTNTLQAFKDGLKNREPWAVAINSLPAANEMIMKPLFEVYIPRLKIGAFLKEYSLELAMRGDQIALGKMTRPELARNVWDSIENRFGEMNFDNLFWDRTFKTSLQLVIRSTTWTLGAIKNVTLPLPRQIMDFAKPISAGRLPVLNNDFAYLMGVTTLFSAFSAVTQMLFTGQAPQDFRDLRAPRIDSQGNRIMLNTHLKDWVHFFHSPAKFIQNKLTGEIGRVMETLQNKDFYGTQIYNEDDPLIRQVVDIGLNLFPTPFSISNLMQERDKRYPQSLRVTTVLGITNPPPSYITNSPAQEKANEIMREKLPAGSRTKQQAEHSKFKSELAIDYRRTLDYSPISAAIRDGKITPKEGKEIKADSKLSPLEHRVKNFTPEQVEEVMRRADKNELKILLPIFEKKMEKHLKNVPGDQKREQKEYSKKVIEHYRKISSGQ